MDEKKEIAKQEAAAPATMQQPLAQYADPALVASAEAAKARIQAAYIMAVQKPRNTDQARSRILHACKRPAFAEKVEFSKPVGGRAIKGPSIRFAEHALREWGNIMSDVQVLYEDDKYRRSRVLIIDLETNSSFSKEIQVSKTVERKTASDRVVIARRVNTRGEQVFVVQATDDELHNKEAALVSKAIRNEGLRLIPSDIIDEALEIAHETLKNEDAKDPDAAKKKVLDAFSDINISPVELEKFLGHKCDIISPAELQTLRGIYQAITEKDSDTTWYDIIGKAAEAEAPAPAPTLKMTLTSMAAAAQEPPTGTAEAVSFAAQQAFPPEPPPLTDDDIPMEFENGKHKTGKQKKLV